MQLNNVTMAVRRGFGRLFKKRSIIVVSEHKVNHIPVSARSQLLCCVLGLGFISWASYSTGSFMAARSTLKAQNHTLRSVASARVDSLHVAPLQRAVSPKLFSKSNESLVALADPSSALAGVDSSTLYARIAFLEQKVDQLQTANHTIIQRVEEKTSSKLSELESLIKQTGLNPETLKKEASKLISKNDNADGENSFDAQGGPFIPDDSLGLEAWQNEIFSKLDRVALLQKIVNTLPLDLPIKGAAEMSTFGRRIDPFTGRLALHAGLDLAGPAGSKIYSPAGGKITSAERSSSYGNMIEIDHGFGVSTRYGHLSEILVKEGQKVEKGKIIGVQGSTGRSTGAHLHYEVRYYDQPMNPKRFLKAGNHVSEE
jgi:murein DD-endopeptidase MepM/ murein hydrolase activator NlpD